MARAFNNLVRQGMDEIARDPERFRFVERARPVRQFRLRRFPFRIMYVNLPTHVWVVAVAHDKRRPHYWAERLREDKV